ncbi:MAG: hypothetical protein WCO43_04140 [Chitinophagia bacterium]
MGCRHFLFTETGGLLAVRMGKWKGIKKAIRRNPSQPWMLFDLDKEPAERVDIASRFPQIIRKIKAIAKKEHQHPLLKNWELFPENTTSH